jgi:hypothetical protein
MAKRSKVPTAMLDGVSGKHNEMHKLLPSRPAVRVECPREGDVIAQPCYSFHIAAAPGAEGVEVSIDQGEWMSCRESLGIWWYDWSAYGKGEHELVARARISDGIAASSSPRLFTVD